MSQLNNSIVDDVMKGQTTQVTTNNLPYHLEWLNTYLAKYQLTALSLNNTDEWDRMMFAITAQLDKKSETIIKKIERSLPALQAAERSSLLKQIGEYVPCTVPAVSSMWTNPPAHIDDAIKYFIYQVKRKALGLPIKRKVVLNFMSSTQQVGKSGLVKRILGISPLSTETIVPKELVGAISVNHIGDDRYGLANANKLVLFLDEFSGANKSDSAAFKRWVTDDFITTRRMHSQVTTNCANRSTCIGTSNVSVSYLIHDETGMARFWEINFTPPDDISAYDSYPWKALWQSIDPNADFSTIEAAIQANTYNKKLEHSSIDAWLEVAVYGDKTQSSTLHKEYCEFCKINNYKQPVSNRQFTMELKDRGWSTKRANTGMFLVPPDSIEVDSYSVDTEFEDNNAQATS